MLLVIRHRYPRLANVLGLITGIASLAIAIACGASMIVLILGGGSSIALAVVRFVGKRERLASPR
jgi:hypothetical protein